MRQSRTFNQEKLSAITSLFNQGLGARKIASALGLSRAIVKKALNTLGLHHPKGYVNPQIKQIGTHQICSGCEENKSVDDFQSRKINGVLKVLSRCLDCRVIDNSKAHKRKLQKLGKITRPKNNAPILQEELSKIKSFFEQGLTRKQIGNILGRSAIRISKAYKELGIIGKAGTTKRVSKEEQKENAKRKWREDPVFRLRKLVSVCIGGALKKNGKLGKGNSSVMDFLPYSIEELKTHIENQFEPWMTWENQGKWDKSLWDDNDPATWTWQLDHIIPHSTFSYDTMDSIEFQECWALSNLRPLNTQINAIDGAKRKRHYNKYA